MLDLRFLRENPEIVRQNIKNKFQDEKLPLVDQVLELDGQLIGNVMYTRSWLLDEQDNRKTILSFGPISIHPAYQRKGYGKQLLEHSFAAVRELGYDAIVIFGNPDNYVSR